MAKKESKENAPKQDLLAPSSAPPRVPGPFDEFDQWFEDFLPPRWIQPFFRRGWPDLEPAFGTKPPKIDVIDRANEVVVRAELPGVKKDDLEVSLSDNVLTLRARTHSEREEEKGHYHRREISRGEIQRSVRLPAAVEGDKTTATFKDGVLELVAPKTTTSQRQTIKVD
ncbi:Hsp20/alpha crystallin family protein [Methylococcus sp. EFPC2]|uniref:Hsp20/alpha crystallin family protein n=1 Tax=Methylococcus sp. EFPC2 TaxID=2812648 RepID=UPI0019675DB5|nr:Hsp20/alpha crystallin family protein [Methylococcus sp. EFPC2]QSA96073.1 Hsp20/alpha crystallin family protein [Methylococcus sp. EFPC2]